MPGAGIPIMVICVWIPAIAWIKGIGIEVSMIGFPLIAIIGKGIIPPGPKSAWIIKVPITG
jgi:hypothetical protein